MDGFNCTANQCLNKPKGLSRASLVRSRKGQVVLEYVLLMVLMAGLGAFIVRSFVSRNADEPGILVTKWDSILKVIAEDNPED